MRGGKLWFAAGAALVLLALPLPVRAEDPNAAAANVFQSLYGEQIKAVLATGKSEDDVELAGKLLTAARAAADQPALRVLLCEKAYDLAHSSRPGYATAVEAMTLLAENAPARAKDCWEKVLNILQRRFNGAAGFAKLEAGEFFVLSAMRRAEQAAAAGDHEEAIAVARKALPVAQAVKSPDASTLTFMQKHFATSGRIARQAAALETTIKARPADRASRSSLLLLLVVELDNPARAVAFLDAETDEATRTYVPMAAKPPEQIDPSACLELGDWYRSCSLKPSLTNDGKAIAWRRSADYYQQYLDRGGEDNLKKMKARLALGDMEKNLQSTGGAWPAKRGGSALPADLLAYARARNRLPPKTQIEVVEHKLQETNGDKKVPFQFEHSPTAVTSASISACANLVSLEALAGLPLTSLVIRGCTNIKDLSPLAGMPLASLKAGGCNSLTNLHGLEGAPLTSLEIGGCAKLASIAALRDSRPKTLELMDMSALESLVGLGTTPLANLSVSNCPKLKDLAGLKGSKLAGLSLYRCAGLTSLAGMEGLALKEFSLRLCHNLESLAPLKGQTASLALDLGGYGKLKNLDGLQGIPLKSLDLQDCASLESLEGLEGVTGTLNISNCPKLKSLAGLKGSKITSISLYRVPLLETFEGIEGLPLTHFSFRLCHNLRSLAALKGYGAKLGITQLELGGYGKLESLDGLQGIPLKNLDCQECRSLAGDLTVLKDARLVELDLTRCEKITSLRGLEGQPIKSISLRYCGGLGGDLTPLKDSSITVLNVSSSPDLSLKGLENLKLTSLNVNGQNLSAEDIDRIKSIKTLQTVSTGNDRRDAEITKALQAARGGK